jgi:hypothetical protein
LNPNGARISVVKTEKARLKETSPPGINDKND